MKHFFRGRKSEKKAAVAPAPAPVLAPTPTPAPAAAVTVERRSLLASSTPVLAASVGVSARASSHSVPDFGFTSIQNSTGASAAVAELSEHLDILLSDWNSSDDFGARRRQLGNKLQKRAEEHLNARLDTDHDASPWQHSAVDLAVLTAAIKCSVAAYDPTANPVADKLTFETVHSIPASKNGVIKATTFTRVTAATASQSLSGESFPALVVAIRGSFKMIDWVVNANYQSYDAHDLLASAEWLPQGRAHETFKVHSGFRNGAKALLPSIKQQLQADSGRTKHVIFTGHSAGGAVASLLYLHFLGIANQSFPSLRFSLVTFGSPPVTAPSVTELVNGHLKGQANPGLAVSVVNETDVVTRADDQYVLSLANLYRSIDGLPPIAGTESQPRADGPTRHWPLPPPVLHHVGNVVVLKEMDEESDDPQIKAFSVPGPKFARLLFCSSSAHHKQVYEQALKRLRDAEQAST